MVVSKNFFFITKNHIRKQNVIERRIQFDNTRRGTTEVNKKDDRRTAAVYCKTSRNTETDT